MRRDIIIIGAGVVGCALARELSKYEANIVVLEKASDIAEGASKSNSGIIHAGHDAKPGSMKAEMNVLGAKMYPEIAKEVHAPYKQIGALIIGFNEDDRELLNELLEQGKQNGVEQLQIIESEEIIKLEPNINKDVLCALYIPTSAISSPYEMTYALADHACVNGVEFKMDTEVNGFKYKNDKWHVSTNNGEYTADIIVNCAGLFSAKLHNLISSKKYNIILRKGEYFLLDRKKPLLFERTIFQTPTVMGKGVLISPTVHGNIIIGPSAKDIDDPMDVTTTYEKLTEVFEKAKLTWPEINKHDVITTFAGIRAHEENGDFVIGAVEGAKNAYEALGIESPGLSASPAIADKLTKQIVSEIGIDKKFSWLPAPDFVKPFHDMTTEERAKAVKSNPKYGNLVCRCEQVTEAEIIAAIHRPVGAKNVDGVKRRTRAGMGRCQSGFCSPRVMQILCEELNLELDEVTKDGGLSNFLIGKIDEDAQKGE